jgi:hypothetical protein
LVVNTRNEGLIKTLGGFSIVAGIAVGLSSFGIATIGMHREAGIGAVVASGLIVLGMYAFKNSPDKSKKMKRRLTSKEKQLEGVEEWKEWYHENPNPR